jgi:hypothetical protein
MGVRLGSVFSNAIVGSPALAAETIICTTGALNLAVDNAQVLLVGFVEITIGTSGVSLTLRLRRGAATSSTLINVGSAATVAATNVVRHSICYADSPGVVAGVQYSLTAQVGSGAAASNVSDVGLMAMVL